MQVALSYVLIRGTLLSILDDEAENVKAVALHLQIRLKRSQLSWLRRSFVQFVLLR